MSINENKTKVIEVESERLAIVENEVKHQGEDIHEIKSDISEIKESSRNVELAVVELAEIAKDNKRIYPRLEAIESKQGEIATTLAKWTGAITVIMFVVTFFGREIRAIIGG